LDLRSLKETLGMGVLRCHSPAMVRKEVAGSSCISRERPTDPARIAETSD
jgi:hypothetical protein